MNNNFKRTTELVLAWIGNIFLILTAGLFSYLAFSNTTKELLNSNEFRTTVESNLSSYSNVDNISFTDLISIIHIIFTAFAAMFIISLILALIATFTIKKRILSAILFIIAALLTGIFTVGYLIPVYLPYLVAGLMLIFRKPPMDDNKYDNYNNNKTIDKMEYI